MYFEHIFDQTLAHSSYIIGCQVSGEALVIDPKRDVDSYLQIAQHNNLHITHITETHIHADYLSGSLELAELTKAQLYLSDEGGADWQYQFPHIGLKHGDTIKIGNLVLEVIHTPGHTPESISFLLTDKAATEAPIMLFSGDFVFVGDVGRPDLLEAAAGIEGSKEIGAAQLYDSLSKFRNLPSYVQVWPAHGAGSACGKALGAVPSTTVGYELIRNWAFQFGTNQEGFTESLLADQPEAPRYFAQMKKLNKILRPLVLSVPTYTHLSWAEAENYLQQGAQLIDTREKSIFAKGHLPGALNIQHTKSFNTWAGWVIDYERPIILVAEDAETEALARKLMRIGLDQVVGYLRSADLMAQDTRLVSSKIIDFDTMKARLTDTEYQVLDVRSKKEFEQGHLPGAKNIFVGHLLGALDQLDSSKKIALHCQAGDRATIAQSLLKAQGFEQVESYMPSMREWIEKEGPLVS